MRVKEYEYDKATVDAWLNNGGAEIVLETLRRRGWDIEVQTGDGWPFVDEVVVVADRETATMAISGYKSTQTQALFAAMVDKRYDPVRGRSMDTRAKFMYPMLCESDKFIKEHIELLYHYIDEIRTSSEAAIACMARKEIE